ncbi:Electron transfer flavoprotein alpha/beta-subunit [mine drainage metagenome]|uniref:Electron transfer flavoprotein alpha/beta-subunit n=1 Tax=mine drainage metagenome TaxID=410659 RepID=T0YZP4_9ZZZZ
MEIVVCVKPVPDPDTRLTPGPDRRSLDTEGVKFVLAGYDESAVEQALLLKEQIPGSAVRAVAYGPAPRTPRFSGAASPSAAIRPSIWSRPSRSMIP